MWMRQRRHLLKWVGRMVCRRTNRAGAVLSGHSRVLTAGADRILAETGFRRGLGAAVRSVLLQGLATGLVLWPGLAHSTACLPGAPDAERDQLQTGRVESVRPDGALVLDDGRLVTLAGLYLDGTAAQSLTGRQLRLLPVEDPDRWGRVLVLAFDGDLLQAQLLAEGLAAVWPLMVPASLPPGCDAEFARAEAGARAARKGLWGRSVPQPGPQPGLRQDARDPQAVLARNGRFAIVEGRVESLGKARDTRYLNFGGRWATDFTVTFSSSIEGQLAAKGMDPARMEGARVRVRGVVLEKDGPHIEVTDPAQIEWAN